MCNSEETEYILLSNKEGEAITKACPYVIQKAKTSVVARFSDTFPTAVDTMKTPVFLNKQHNDKS
jgi:hypothetical protein